MALLSQAAAPQIDKGADLLDGRCRNSGERAGVTAAVLATSVSADGIGLAPHVAASTEIIPDLGECFDDGAPDMRRVLTINDMIAELRTFDDDEVGYVTLWREHFASIGGSVMVHVTNAGEKTLAIVLPCDTQIRHRNRWAYFLIKDLEGGEQRRAILTMVLLRERLLSDERPIDAPTTTRVMRDFLRAGGRILINPDGDIIQGSGMPASFRGTGADADRAVSASRAYCDMRQRFRSDRQIRLAARLFGRRTDNGWMVLERRS